jgi:hypothetical protein
LRQGVRPYEVQPRRVWADPSFWPGAQVRGKPGRGKSRPENENPRLRHGVGVE